MVFSQTDAGVLQYDATTVPDPNAVPAWLLPSAGRRRANVTPTTAALRTCVVQMYRPHRDDQLRTQVTPVVSVGSWPWLLWGQVRSDRTSVASTFFDDREATSLFTTGSTIEDLQRFTYSPLDDLYLDVACSLFGSQHTAAVHVSLFDDVDDVAFSVVLKGDEYDESVMDDILDIEYELQQRHPDLYLNFGYVFEGERCIEGMHSKGVRLLMGEFFNYVGQTGSLGASSPQ